MKLIRTKFLEREVMIDVDSSRIHKTNCKDKHFINIIEDNRLFLENVIVDTPYLYLLIDNTNFYDENFFYAAISFQAMRRGNSKLYIPCVVILDNISNKKESLIYLVGKVLENLATENNVYVGMSKNDDNRYNLKNEQNIKDCTDCICSIIEK